jgi:hypothetical protein
MVSVGVCVWANEGVQTVSRTGLIMRSLLVLDACGIPWFQSSSYNQHDSCIIHPTKMRKTEGLTLFGGEK